MRRIALLLVFAIMISVMAVGCNNDVADTPIAAPEEPMPILEPVFEPETVPVAESGDGDISIDDFDEISSLFKEAPPIDWLSPMISVEKDTNTVSLWNGEYNLHRNETMEYVFRDGDALEDIMITEDALVAGGAVPATLRVSYGGEGRHLVRLVAFAYHFFDHGRPTRLNAHAPEPNPQDILILWRNPENGHWFNMVQNGVGREAVTLGQNHDDLVSLRNDNPVYTFLLNSETVEVISELTVFIVATAAPTRDNDYERSGYSMLFTLELPDLDNHFHSWEILAACGTMFLVGE